VVRTMNNVTRMVNVTVTVHELCLNLSEGFLCTRQLTHTVPRITVETVTRCCPGYISDHNGECVQIREEEKKGSGAHKTRHKAHKTQPSDWTPISVIVISLILLTLMIIGKKMMKKYWRSYADKIQAAWAWSWSHWSHLPSEAEIKDAARMASFGHLTSVKYMKILNKSITDVPRDQMEKLASIVTEIVFINNMKHTDQLSSILAGIKCQVLCLEKMDLGFAETRALVTAMWDRVERVELEDVTLVIEELLQYNGQGRCRELRLGHDMWTRYGDKLKRCWAHKGHLVKADNEGRPVMVKCLNKYKYSFKYCQAQGQGQGQTSNVKTRP